MKKLLNALAPLLLVGALAGCATSKIDPAALLASKLAGQAAVKPDSTTGSYGAETATEIGLLDELLRKYPGKQRVRTVVRDSTVVLPGKTVFVEIPVRVDTVAITAERDSLLARMLRVTRSLKTGADQRAGLAQIKAELFAALSSRGYLPDTTVAFPEYGLILKITRHGNRYEFQLTQAERRVTVPTSTTEVVNGRVVKETAAPTSFWWFWLLLAILALLAALVVALLILLLRNRRAPPE